MPRDLVELEKELNELWNSLEQEFLEPFLASMSKRFRLVIASSKGNHIDY